MTFSLLLYAPVLWQGLLLTLKIFVLAMVGVLLIGFAGGIASLLPIPWLRRLVRVYTTILRGLPELITILGLFLGSSVVVSWLLRRFSMGEYYEPDALAAGVLALSLTFGAYAIEIVRGAFFAVARGDLDAAYSLGMKRNAVYWHVVLPQLVRHALPGLGNLALVVLKDTALLSVIGVDDLMRQTRIAISHTREPFTFYLAAAALYLLLTIVTLYLIRRVERWACRGWPLARDSHDLF